MSYMDGGGKIVFTAQLGSVLRRPLFTRRRVGIATTAAGAVCTHRQMCCVHNVYLPRKTHTIEPSQAKPNGTE